jgi:glutathione S-transferase
MYTEITSQSEGITLAGHLRTMPLTLYVADPSSVRGIGASPPSWMCAALLADKGISHTVVELSFARGEHRSPAMLERNPRGTIPVLTDGDIVVHETFAILTYVELLSPGHLPAEKAERGLALTRFFEAEHLKAAGMNALAYVMRTEQAARDPAILEDHGAALRSELERWDGYAATGHVAGAAITLADFAVHPYVATLRQLGLSLASWPRLAEHHDRMAALPAFVSTRPKLWGDPPPKGPWG